MPEPLIVGNWKMNTTVEEAEGLATTLRHRLEAIGGIQTAVCPPFVSLATVAGALRGSSVAVGAQNMHFEARGAYTGEVAPEMLANTCRYVVLGHSERRQHFGETDELINRKVKAAGRVGLTPILCVGERLPDREQGRAEDVVKTQLAGCLDGVDSAADLVVAYEPVLGHRHRQGGHARRGTGADDRYPTAAEARATALTPQPTCLSCTAEASRPTTRSTSCVRRTSTALWSAAPAWTLTHSSR